MPGCRVVTDTRLPPTESCGFGKPPPTESAGAGAGAIAGELGKPLLEQPASNAATTVVGIDLCI